MTDAASPPANHPSEAPIDNEAAGWIEFCDSLDLGQLVPEGYARYRPAVVEGMVFFLENLSAARTWEVLAAQAELDDDAGVEERVVAIARCCPALHKLGQVLARDRRLPETFRVLLQSLESMPATLDADAARAAVVAELGPLEPLGVRIDEPPLAEASVAVVIPFRWQRDGGDQPVRGVFKLLKPGIEARLTEELDILQRIGALLDARCQLHDLPPIDYEATFLEVRDLLAWEVHLEKEQEHLRAARVTYKDLKAVLIPELYPLSTPRLTAMQRIDGVKVTEVGGWPVKMRHRLANAVVEALIARPLWSRGSVSVFHADPHAGNLFATPDGRLAVLDWSLVGRLDKADQIGLTQIILGAVTLDAARIDAAIRTLARDRVDGDALRTLIAGRLELLREGKWPTLSWLMGLVDEAATTAKARFAGGLIMFRKVLQTLDGVIADVSADCRVDRVLTAALIRQLLREWGRRPIAGPFTRHFATHVSNLDLMQMWFSAPLIVSRYALTLEAALLARIADASAEAGEAPMNRTASE
jgi:Predicted unusual protein kinase